MAQDYSLQQKIKKAVRNKKFLNLEIKKKFQICFQGGRKKTACSSFKKKGVREKSSGGENHERERKRM